MRIQIPRHFVDFSVVTWNIEAMFDNESFRYIPHSLWQKIQPINGWDEEIIAPWGNEQHHSFPGAQQNIKVDPEQYSSPKVIVKSSMNNTVIQRDSNDVTVPVYQKFHELYHTEPTETFRIDFSSGLDPVKLRKYLENLLEPIFGTDPTFNASKMLVEERTNEVYTMHCDYYFHKEHSLAMVWCHQGNDSYHKFCFLSHGTDQKLIDIQTLIFKKMEKALKKFKKPLRQENSKFGIVTRTSQGFDLTYFDIRRMETDIIDQYNDDFAKIHERVMTSLNTLDKNGLVLFYGEPGTGKTTYLRYLIGKLKKNPIYLPPDLAHMIASPDFVSFLSENPNSVLIIEDAENVLKTREAGGNQAVSNLLNVSDGILGDALNMQIICTFNTEYSEIDSALKRPGRLIAEYKFGALNAAKTAYMVEKLYGKDTQPKKASMTVAEIYGMNQEHLIVEKKKHSIGFTGS